MPRFFKDIRTQLTFNFTIVLTFLLLVYAVINLTFQHNYLKRQLDLNLKEDFEIVEELLVTNEVIINPFLTESDHVPQPYERFVEIWSLDGRMLYHSSAFQFEELPPAPNPGRYGDTLQYFSFHFPGGEQWRTIGAIVRTPHGDRIVRISMSEGHIRAQILEFVEFLLLISPFFFLFTVGSGYLLARQSLKPIDIMIDQVRSFDASKIEDRLHILNPVDELGNLAGVLNDLLNRLQTAFEQLKRFTADASHELRTPLTVMRSVGEVALQGSHQNVTYREAIGSMLEENNRLTRLIDCLLFLSKADSNAVALSADEFDLIELIKETQDILSVLSDEKKQTITFRSDQTLSIIADKTLLRRAIINLLDNAIKYSPRGGEININASAVPGGVVRVSFTDSGPGVPEEFREAIFNRFYRLEKDRARDTGGAGLGLSIVQWIVSAHKGHVWVEASAHGSVFILEIPTLPPSGSVKNP